MNKDENNAVDFGGTSEKSSMDLINRHEYVKKQFCQGPVRQGNKIDSNNAIKASVNGRCLQHVDAWLLELDAEEEPRTTTIRTARSQCYQDEYEERRETW